MSTTRHRVSTNGIELVVIDAGTPGDPVVVLVHGFPGSSHSWRHQVQPLVDAGHRGSILIDGAGHRTRQERPDEFNAALLELLARLT
jgi:pimeloyl-ACP methyl ester carboxylesterase